MIINIIQGLMLDAFAKMRQTSEQRSNILENECFVCGISRKEYQNLNLGTEYMNFDQHRDKGHDRWSYVYFINYVSNKVRNFMMKGSIEGSEIHFLPLPDSHGRRQWHLINCLVWWNCVPTWYAIIAFPTLAPATIQDPTERNGVEQFVGNQIKKRELSWVPYRDSFEMQIRDSKEKAKASSTAEKAQGE